MRLGCPKATMARQHRIHIFNKINDLRSVPACSHGARQFDAGLADF